VLLALLGSFLARYTGQRKGDCCDMGWSDIDLKGNRIHVVQEKTGKKIWVPLHKRLKKYLATLPRSGAHSLISPATGKRYAKQSITNYVTARCAALGHAGWSAHGLRHSAGLALAEPDAPRKRSCRSWATTPRSRRRINVKQASQHRLANNAVTKWDNADESTGHVLPMAAPRKRRYKANKAA
jgi:hypothetical protein